MPPSLISTFKEKGRRYGIPPGIKMEMAGLLRTLIDPRTDQANLSRRERSDPGPVVERRHPILIVVAHVRHGLDEHAFGAVTGHDDLAVLAAFKCTREAVELQVAFGLVAAVTLDA